jgi:hypothetical protein
MVNVTLFKKTILLLIPSLSLIFGFLFQEDLSTGGNKMDFLRTFPAVIDFSNFIFNTTHEYTRHFPLHYFILSIPQLYFNDIFITKLIYCLFSLLLPFLIYLNITKLYTEHKFNILIIAISFLFFPFYRASSFWPNAHLTALIFLLSANYFYLVGLNCKNFIYKFLNIFFLSLVTYSVQSYVVFFIYYLVQYYKNESLKTFFYLFLFCIIFSLPGFYILITTDIGPRLTFSSNFSYTIITNFSIIFFCLLFFLINKNNFFKIKDILININKFKIILFLSIFLLLFLNYENHLAYGGGFFYKISNVFFNNNYFFYLTGFLGLIVFYTIYKIDKKIFYIILLINFNSIAYITSQKYFDPILIILIFVLNKNFFSKNIITNHLNTLTFYCLALAYFIAALINNNYGITRNSILNF